MRDGKHPGISDKDVDLRGGQRVYIEEDGTEYVLDEMGNHVPPMQSKRDSAEGEFTTYDMSQGHCGLCGRLTCRGSCFK